MTYKLSFSFSIFVAASAGADGAWKPDTTSGRQPRTTNIASKTPRFIAISFHDAGFVQKVVLCRAYGAVFTLRPLPQGVSPGVKKWERAAAERRQNRLFVQSPRRRKVYHLPIRRKDAVHF